MDIKNQIEKATETVHAARQNYADKIAGEIMASASEIGSAPAPLGEVACAAITKAVDDANQELQRTIEMLQEMQRTMDHDGQKLAAQLRNFTNVAQHLGRAHHDFNVNAKAATNSSKH